MNVKVWVVPLVGVVVAVAIAEVARQGGVLAPGECPQCDAGDNAIYESTMSEPCLGPGGLVIDTRWYAPDPPCIDEDNLCSRCCDDAESAYWACLITYGKLKCLPYYTCKSACCEDEAVLDFVESAACPGLENQIIRCPDA